MKFQFKNTRWIFVLLVPVALSLSALQTGTDAGKPARVAEVPQQYPNIADLSAALSPTVVYIESIVEAHSSQNPTSPFEFFMQPDRGPRSGLGSGVIVDANGYIITNNHVVADADKIRVTLNDGREYPAKVVGTDPQTDVAVIKIEEKNLTYALFGDSDKVRVGDWVVAIGNPLGYRYTVTFGIVSALGRSSIQPNTIENYIQTDAAINQGNSGGPLIDMKGQVIGINTAISAYGQNIGFSIPVNMVRNAYEQIRANGTVSRGAIGIGLQELTSELKEYYGVTHGSLINTVSQGSPGEKAGLQPGDVITEVDGKTVRDNGHLVSMVANKAPGDPIALTILRKGKEQKVSLTLGDRAVLANARPSRTNPIKPESKPNALELKGYGLTAIPLSEADRAELAFEPEEGFVIAEVDEESPAFEKGIRPGQVLLQVNDWPVSEKNRAKIEKELEPGQSVIRLQIQTERGTQLVGVRPKK
ncbi:MAG: Do family serine endopeptidase [Acidobacteria bacterium]|nr:Do family serine endopeptidase [Acidobacteriota bacterium]MCB9398123.1 Do family serine endopeptidase [Acidobacteriota bacterium]